VIDNDIVFNCGGVAGLNLQWADYNYVYHNRVLNSTGVGIQVYWSSNCVVFNNSVMGNSESVVGEPGLLVTNGDYNDIVQNNVSYNNYEGIHISSSSFTDIIDNTIIGNIEQGIYMDSTDNTTIHNNTIFNNTFAGIYLTSSIDNTLTENKVSYNDFAETWTGGIYLESNSHRNWLENNHVSNNKKFGVRIWGGQNTTLIYNKIVDNCGGEAGLYLEQSHYSDVFNNTVSNSTGVGIQVYESNNCVFFNNTVLGNGQAVPGDPGVYEWSSQYNTWEENDISYNNYDGMWFSESSHTNIINNIIQSNPDRGLFLYLCDNTTISGNDITGNDGGNLNLSNSIDNEIYENLISSSIDRGVYIDASSTDNLIYHNNFIGNAEHAYDEGMNTWNLSFPMGGNWWDDWTIPDVNFDGFVDNPRIIPGGANQDDWPFTNMDGWLFGNWFYKPPYPNYAPAGMPDFDQRQAPWQTMLAGPNGVTDSVPMGDDVLINPAPGPNGIGIAPGPNHILDSAPMVDDIPDFSYCGPTAAANSLWWFDSKFANIAGVPGDGLDDYLLVPDLGAGDDHAANNVPLLIEELAMLFQTNMEGVTNVSNMVSGLDQYLMNHGYDAFYEVYNVSFPTYEFVADGIRNCSDVLIFLGFYEDTGNRVSGHIVTSAGINEAFQQIAISDPIVDISSVPAGFLDHNDPLNVSHDIYNATPAGPFVPGLPPMAWQLEGYNSGYIQPMPPMYGVVENVVIVSPINVTIDYIDITDIPDGIPLTDDIVPVGFQKWGNASAYNNSLGYIGTVTADWTVEGGLASLLGPSPSDMNGIDLGLTAGTVWFNASFGGFSDSVVYTVPAPTVDYIEITDTPDGIPIADKTVGVGFTEWGYCSAYNNTSGYIGTVSADWSVDGSDAALLNGTTTEYNGVDVGTNGADVWLNASFGGFNDSVQYTVNPPTIDYIEITDTPGGTIMPDGSVPIGFLQSAFCSAYNDTIGYAGIVQADWTAEGGNSSLIGITPWYNITIDVGNATGEVWLNASYLGYNASVLYTVIPGIDYIDITYDPGVNPVADASVPVGFIIWANCSAYNNTVGYLGTVSADWTAEGGGATLLALTPSVMNGINVGIIWVEVWLNASFGGINDSVKFTILVPVVDYIEITAAGGTPIPDKNMIVGSSDLVYCTGFNNTAGNIGLVAADWTAQGGDSSLIGITPETTIEINVGAIPGERWLNASYMGHNDSIKYTVLPPTVDYIEITDTPNGTLLPGATVLVDYIEWANCSAYNNTVGFIGTVAANWTVEGGNATLLAATPSVMNGINVGNITGFVWLNASYGIYTFSVQYTVTGITIDYIEITATPNGTSLLGGIVDVGFSIWGNCSAYNLSIGFMGIVDAVWSAQGGSASLLGPTPADLNGIDVGTTVGTVWFNATYGGLSDSVRYILSLPTEPENLIIISGESFINITWTAPDTNGSAPITGYTIYRGNASGNEVFLAAIGNALYYEDTNVTNGETYYYTITASNSLGEGDISIEVSDTAGAVPSQPQDLDATAGDSVITLSWKAPSTDGGLPITNYRIYKGTTPGSGVFEFDVGTDMTYTDLAVSNGIIYYYTVSAVNAIGEGPQTDETSDTPKGVPSAPHSLTFEAGDAYVHITWSVPTMDGGAAITNYNIYRGPDPDNLTFLIQVDNELEYNDTGLTNNETYFYVISAENIEGEGPQSNNVNATPDSPIIPINKPPRIVINKPADGAEVHGFISVAGTSSDTDGTVESVQIRIDDRGWIDVEAITEWSYKIDTTNLSNGPHSIYVRAYDGENYSEEASISIEVNNPAEPKEKSVFEEAWFWAFIILVIIILIVLFFMIFGKKMRDRPEKEYYDEEEEDDWEEEEDDEEPEEEPEDEEDEEPEEEAEDEPDLEDE
jgi:parallel beta-helix repeat protein